MKRFNQSELEALTECPGEGSEAWLAGAEDSITYLVQNMESDEAIIYASAKSVLIHGVLVQTSKVAPPDTRLQYDTMPMTDDCWAIAIPPRFT